MVLRNNSEKDNNKIYIDQFVPAQGTGNEGKVVIKTFYVQDTSREIVGVDLKCTDGTNCILLVNLATQDNIMIINLTRSAKFTEVTKASLIFTGMNVS